MSPIHRRVVLVAILLLVATVPAASASHFSDSCDGWAPKDRTCNTTIPSAHAGGINIGFKGTDGDSSGILYSGVFYVVIDHPGGTVRRTCGPWAFGLTTTLISCLPSGSFPYTPGKVDISIQADGVGEWQITIQN